MTVARPDDETRGVLAVIPARWASSRFPGKPLAPILGVPMVLRVHARVAAAIPPAQVLVATDDVRIRDVCVEAGVRVAMTSSRCPTGTDRAWEATRHMDADVVLNVQGDEPMIDPADVLAVLHAWRARPGHVVNAMCPIADAADVASPNVPKVVAGGNGRLAYISRAPVPFARGGTLVPVRRRQVCIYAFGPRELARYGEYGRQSPLERPEDIEILRFLDLDVPVHMVEVRGASLAVDVPGDIARVEAAFAGAGDPVPR
jgi:3-deoxy-manno-octulosonate cytidylyltransferase (CMP-KDO synthetase)